MRPLRKSDAYMQINNETYSKQKRCATRNQACNNFGSIIKSANAVAHGNKRRKIAINCKLQAECRLTCIQTSNACEHRSNNL